MPFLVGTTRDLMRPDGTPTFGTAALDVLKQNADIAWEWLAEDVPEITPDIAARYDGLHLNSARVTPATLARADCRLKVIARNGVGYDTVDLDAATRRGIVVTNTPRAMPRPVAVAGLTMLLALAGRLVTKNALVRAGRWMDRVDYMGVGLTTRTLGVVGAGGIGQELLRLSRPFFKRTIAADPYADPAKVHETGAEIVPLDRLMAEADFVVCCCLLNAETRHLIDARRLALMKPTAFFVNMARGPVHDEAALVEALRAGRIAGAGLDVTEIEPIPPDSPLLAMDNVVITAHALCWTDECFHEMAQTALQSIVDVSRGKRPVHVVNASVA
jgi:phosphoglycerate dehydrogenase-like enzyme